MLVAVLWSLLALVEEPTSTGTVPVHIELKPPLSEVRGIALDVTPSLKRLEPLPDSATGGSLDLPAGSGPWTVRLPKGTKWLIQAKADGYWVRGRELVVGERVAEPVVLTVWPLGALRGRIALADPHSKLPRSLLLTTLKPRRSQGRQDTPVFQLRCPVDAEGAWRCQLPAARYDLGFSAEGFSPIYSPKGLPLTNFAVGNAEKPTRLAVSPQMGTLELVLPGEEKRDPLALPAYLERNGIPVPMAALRRRAALSSAQFRSAKAGDWMTLTVPQVATGSYRLCLSPAGELVPPSPDAACVAGELSDQGVLRLDLAADDRAP